ncbi:hypothetical protein EDB85DRAFT_1887193 [Lactarius pseudohatsudake]|nr:hypothetical protein EDB85DRAFT_1887193 [Lactarius pseudohatsudake]
MGRWSAALRKRTWMSAGVFLEPPIPDPDKTGFLGFGCSTSIKILGKWVSGNDAGVEVVVAAVLRRRQCRSRCAVLVASLVAGSRWRWRLCRGGKAEVAAAWWGQGGGRSRVGGVEECRGNVEVAGSRSRGSAYRCECGGVEATAKSLHLQEREVLPG